MEAVKGPEKQKWNYTLNMTIELNVCKNDEHITRNDYFNNENHCTIGSWLGTGTLYFTLPHTLYACQETVSQWVLFFFYYFILLGVTCLTLYSYLADHWFEFHHILLWNPFTALSNGVDICLLMKTWVL